MRLTGSGFCCEVPDGWTITAEPGCVTAVGEPSELAFASNVVLRESRIDAHAGSLAALSYANLGSLEEVMPGALVLGVESGLREGVEKRITWLLRPVRPKALHGNILCLLLVQALMVVDDMVAELTVTTPLVEWSGDQCQQILDTLVALPVAERCALPTVTQVPDAVLDDWATRRDGRPREDLSIIRPPQLVTQDEPMALTETAVSALVKMAKMRVFAPTIGAVREELIAAGLADKDGHLNSTGFWYIDHLMSGEGWSATVSPAGDGQERTFRFWVTDATTVFIAPTPKDDNRRLMGFCPSNDLFRLVLGWLLPGPAWPLDFEFELTPAELQAKKKDQSLRVAGDAGEFVAAPWTICSLEALAGNALVSWIQTPNRGSATLGAKHKIFGVFGPQKFVARQHPDEPLWLLLINIIAAHGQA